MESMTDVIDISFTMHEFAALLSEVFTSSIPSDLSPEQLRAISGVKEKLMNIYAAHAGVEAREVFLRLAEESK